MMRAVSLRRPQADAIASGDALPLFTRMHRTPYRGRIALHVVDERVIVAVADLVDVVEIASLGRKERADLRRSLRRDANGPHVYVLGNVQRVEPVECAGRGGGVWQVPAKIEALLG